MLGACLKGYIVNRYGYANVLGNGFKYIHCDLTDPLGYLTITLTIGSSFVFTFSLRLNVGSFIWVLNFEVIFRNMFEKGDWEFILRVMAITIIEHIDLFPICLHFVFTHSILDFIRRENLEELKTMELVVNGIYG
jgi:hypothetical protein